jgi:hypothetical protein
MEFASSYSRRAAYNGRKNVRNPPAWIETGELLLLRQLGVRLPSIKLGLWLSDEHTNDLESLTSDGTSQVMNTRVWDSEEKHMRNLWPVLH